MKIAQVCPYDFSRPGGVQSHIRGLSAELARRGHEVTVIAPRGGGCGAPRDVELLSVGRAWTLGVSGTRIDVVLASPMEMARLRRRRFDVLHLHTPWNPFLPLQVRACVRATACVGTFHDAPPPGPWGQFAARVLMPLAGRFLTRFVLDEAIAVSEVPARILHCRVVPNGIDVQAFTPREADPDGRSIVFVGRLEDRKGVPDLLDAFEVLQRHHPDVTLVIAGDGPLMPVLRRRGASMRSVVIRGAVDEAEKASMLAGATVFCSPARYGESFGIVLLEAMASGTPVVAAANDGYRALVNGCGLLYPPRDVRRLQDCLSELLDCPSRRAELSARGLARAAGYDWRIVTDAIEEIYAQISRPLCAPS